MAEQQHLLWYEYLSINYFVLRIIYIMTTTALRMAHTTGQEDPFVHVVHVVHIIQQHHDDK